VPDYANVLVKVVAIFGVINRAPATSPVHVFCYSAVGSCAYLTPSVSLTFKPKSGFKNSYRARAGFGLVISGSGRFQASKWGPFTTLCGYVCGGQQGEIERIRPPPTNNKNRLKSFCEVGYANFRPNVFSAGKRISMEILVGVWLHAMMPSSIKKICSFFKKWICARKIFIIFATLSDLNKTWNRAVTHTYKMDENWSVLL